MAAQSGVVEDVYATLLLSDTYLPGALVLAHSLRDAGTTKKLAVLVTLDSVSTGVITQLRTVYDYVIPVNRIRNAQPANLQLMNRSDLHSAFTKINLWKQMQFRKIVYIDSDVVAYRAPDELFDTPHPFSAAPDIGWPDLFNTGVMVVSPNMGDFYAMSAMADRGISFDGADQGLINMHFRNNYNRLSFTYNVTPSAHYQYLPAYRHYQSSINMVHFIGSDKPWFQGRGVNTSGSPYDEMVGRWWAVYDRHYRVPSPPTTSGAHASTQPTSTLVQSLTKGEYQPMAAWNRTTGELDSDNQDSGEQYSPTPLPHHEHEHAPGDSHHPYDQHNQHEDEPPRSHVVPQSGDASTSITTTATSVFIASSSPPPSSSNLEGTEAEAREDQVFQSYPGAPPQHHPSFQPTFSSWDAQRHPPPSDSKPEAENFPATVYEMSKDSAPFVPPERYPSPPKNMWYEVPKEPRAPAMAKPKPIFPWENHQPQPSRVFPDEQKPDFGNPGLSTVDTPTASEGQKSEPVTPLTPSIRITSSDPWTAFTRSNAWDEIPEIERYVDSMQQKHRRTRSLKSPGTIALPGSGEGLDEAAWRRRASSTSHKLTDFPSKDERPSLPVTPAPIRRPKFWGPGAGGGGGGGGGDEDDDQLLPAAEGVPEQTHWDPVAQLQKLARQHSDALLQRLGGTEGGGGGEKDGSSGSDSYDDRDNNNSNSNTKTKSTRITDLPLRALPFGSEALVSPTYVAPTPTAPVPAPAGAGHIVSPQPRKGSAATAVPGGGLGPAFLPKGVEDPDATPLAIPPRKPTSSGGGGEDAEAEAREARETETMVFTDPGPALKKGEIVKTEEGE